MKREADCKRAEAEAEAKRRHETDDCSPFDNKYEAEEGEVFEDQHGEVVDLEREARYDWPVWHIHDVSFNVQPWRVKSDGTFPLLERTQAATVRLMKWQQYAMRAVQVLEYSKTKQNLPAEFSYAKTWGQLLHTHGQGNTDHSGYQVMHMLGNMCPALRAHHQEVTAAIYAEAVHQQLTSSAKSHEEHQATILYLRRVPNRGRLCAASERPAFESPRRQILYWTGCRLLALRGASHSQDLQELGGRVGRLPRYAARPNPQRGAALGLFGVRVAPSDRLRTGGFQRVA